MSTFSSSPMSWAAGSNRRTDTACQRLVKLPHSLQGSTTIICFAAVSWPCNSLTPVGPTSVKLHSVIENQTGLHCGVTSKNTSIGSIDGRSRTVPKTSTGHTSAWFDTICLSNNGHSLDTRKDFSLVDKSCPLMIHIACFQAQDFTVLLLKYNPFQSNFTLLVYT